MPEQRDDFDEEWARIVADLTAGDPAEAAHRAEQSAEGDGEGEGAGPGSDVPHMGSAEPDATRSEGAGSDGLAALFEPLRRDSAPPDARRGAPASDAFVDGWEDEGHYSPPPPPEIPAGTPIDRLAWAGTLGGPAALVLLAVTGWDVPRIVWYAAGVAFLAGFITLVWRMPQNREDGWDDGARL